MMTGSSSLDGVEIEKSEYTFEIEMLFLNKTFLIARVKG